jgi:hypothetical protein
MTGFSVSIRETSREISSKERVKLKDTTNAVKLDTATQEGNVIINPDMYAILDIHNENGDDKDYVNYVVIDVDGTKYVTGSQSFWNSFMDIYSEMENETEEWSIEVYRMPSKNRPGKDFITCSII